MTNPPTDAISAEIARLVPCAGLDDCVLSEAAISEMFVHGKKCPANLRPAILAWHERKVEEEREACAELVLGHGVSPYKLIIWPAAMEITSAIRARGKS